MKSSWVTRKTIAVLLLGFIVPALAGQGRRFENRRQPNPAIASFSASPTSVSPGATSTLSWNVSNATTVAITPGSFTTRSLNGSTTVNPTSTTTYTLTATNAYGRTTAMASVHVVGSSAPSVPTNLVATATGTSTITLSWAASTDTGGPGLAGYDIYRCTGASCSPSAIVATSPGTTYHDTGLASATTYTYAVAAYDTSGLTSGKSASASATTQKLSSPTINSFSASPNTVASGGASTLSWNVSNATSVAITPGSFSAATQVGSTTVNPTSTTTYTLTATNANGNATATTSVTVSATSSATPTAPGSLTVTGVTTSTISLSWASSTPPSGASIAYYTVYSGTSASAMSQLATTSATTFTDTGLSNSTTHFYSVTANDNMGDVSPSSSTVSATTGGSALPTLVQHVGTGSNQETGSSYAPGNPYNLTLPNLTGAGNALVLGISFPYAGGRSVRVSDNMGNTWVLAASTPSSPASGTIVSAVYYALNVAAGTQKVTITFDSGLYNFQAELSEFYNVATVSAIDGTSANAPGTGPNLSSGSFTTTSPGDLVYAYGFDTNDSQNVTNLAAGSGFTLLSADRIYGSVAEYEVQSSAGSVNPSFTATGTSDSFNMVSVALKSAFAGTAPGAGIRIVHVYHVLYYSLSTLQFPSTGNLLVCNTSIENGQWNISGITSTPSNTWTEPSSISGYPQIFYAANASTSPNLTFKVGRPSNSVDDPIGFICYDVTGAASSPYDAAAGTPTAGANNSNDANLLNMPNITPSTANGLVFAVMNDGIGPTTGMVGNGLVMDNVIYGGEIDSDQFDNGDGYAHYYNTTTSPINFGWVMSTPSDRLPEYSSADAIAFEAAAP